MKAPSRFARLSQGQGQDKCGGGCQRGVVVAGKKQQHEYYYFKKVS